jgi:hypothetical protein
MQLRTAVGTQSHVASTLHKQTAMQWPWHPPAALELLSQFSQRFVPHWEAHEFSVSLCLRFRRPLFHRSCAAPRPHNLCASPRHVPFQFTKLHMRQLLHPSSQLPPWLTSWYSHVALRQLARRMYLLGGEFDEICNISCSNTAIAHMESSYHLLRGKWSHAFQR